MLDSPVLSLYLHHNMMDFYGSVDDMANCLDVYSELDGAFGRIEY